MFQVEIKKRCCWKCWTLILPTHHTPHTTGVHPLHLKVQLGSHGCWYFGRKFAKCLRTYLPNLSALAPKRLDFIEKRLHWGSAVINNFLFVIFNYGASSSHWFMLYPANKYHTGSCSLQSRNQSDNYWNIPKFPELYGDNFFLYLNN